MDGHLFDVSHSIFRGNPGPEVDAEWERVSRLGPMVMRGDEVMKLGKDPNNVVKAPSEWGYGDNAYIWQFEMQHNIHCLDFIRRYAYFDHYYRPQYAHFNDTPKLDRIHLSHCLYYILQDMRCQPSLNPIVFHWMDGWRTPHADFNLHRQCVDHEKILKWQGDNTVDYMGRSIDKPSDTIIMHGPPGMEQLLED
ncbi:predicted protein [Paecilomyces variotii No. 5]|uniref:Tat pathway signal sequence n=1 Tax=Byssochlamys spectabilis (strain No. 5 / NBRC 109023) TaxID=1356009 RepID=V5FF95_BYSSN|nr:predicted protein [Paecilomyces variotii No. 5]